MMIYPWQWAWFILRRFLTLLVCAIKPQFEREYLTFRNSPNLLALLNSDKFQTGTYQQAINKVVIDKQRLLLYFINSSNLTTFKSFLESIQDESSIHSEGGSDIVRFVVEVNEYYGWLLACKMHVFKVPTTLLIGPGSVGPKIIERHLNKLHDITSQSSSPGVSSSSSPKAPVMVRSIIEEQAIAFERSMQTDLLRQRKQQTLKNRQDNYAKLISDYVVSSTTEDEDVYKLAIQMPEGKRISKLVKADAPLAVLFAIAREENPEVGKISIKSVDPLISFHEEEIEGAIKDSGLYRMQKLFVEWEK